MKRFVLEGTYRVYFTAKSMTGARSVGKVVQNSMRVGGHDGALQTNIQMDGEVRELSDHFIPGQMKLGE